MEKSRLMVNTVNRDVPRLRPALVFSIQGRPTNY